MVRAFEIINLLTVDDILLGKDGLSSKLCLQLLGRVHVSERIGRSLVYKTQEALLCQRDALCQRVSGPPGPTHVRVSS